MTEKEAAAYRLHEAWIEAIVARNAFERLCIELKVNEAEVDDYFVDKYGKDVVSVY